jgi:hypothetical protein
MTNETMEVDTRSRHEKHIAERIVAKSMETFLPLPSLRACLEKCRPCRGKSVPSLLVFRGIHTTRIGYYNFRGVRLQHHRRGQPSLEEKSRMELIGQLEPTSAGARLEPSITGVGNAATLQILSQRQNEMIQKLRNQPR